VRSPDATRLQQRLHILSEETIYAANVSFSIVDCHHGQFDCIEGLGLQSLKKKQGEPIGKSVEDQCQSALILFDFCDKTTSFIDEFEGY
jgi:hypothetical protein